MASLSQTELADTAAAAVCPDLLAGRFAVRLDAEPDFARYDFDSEVDAAESEVDFDGCWFADDDEVLPAAV